VKLSRKIAILSTIIRWRLTWDKRDIDFAKGKPDNPLFQTAREAVSAIPDGAVIAVSGLGGNQHATILHWALKDVFDATGSPSNLTVIAIGGQGGRGKVPGTVDEVGVKGLCTRFITGHYETFKQILTLADQGDIELQCFPQGTLALLLHAQAQGESSVLVPTGVNTEFDPTVGRGTPLAGKDAKQWVKKEGDLLRFEMPPVTVALINAPAADAQGNIYMKNTAMIAESREIAQAARRNGGRVIVVVGKIVEEGYDTPFFQSDEVDAIVYYPHTGQTMGSSHIKPNEAIVLNSAHPLEETVAELRWINDFLKVTPKRSELDKAVGRLAASLFADVQQPGALVNIGTGLPEEACREIYEGGLLDEVTFFTESGVVGGVPGPGVFFGASARPESMVSSAEIFMRAHRELDVTMLGILQVDSQGNVNVSKRGEGCINYVGPGGFIDFSTSAKTVIFIGKWMARGKIGIESGKVVIEETGQPKFVERVDEITFSGAQAVADGRQIFYVTDVGIFTLTPEGVKLIRVMPGIDIQRDILDFAEADILVDDPDSVPLVDASIITNAGFRLAFA
jgi:propionate CoA-transferase